MADDTGDAAFEAAIDTAKTKADAAFAATEATGEWVNWRGADPTTAPWWEAGAEWIWTVLQAGGFLKNLTPAGYRHVAKEVIHRLSLGFFDEELRPHQNRAFGPYSPDMKEVFAAYALARLLPKVTARVLGPVAAKPAERAPMPGDARLVTPTKRHPRTIGTKAAAKRMEAHLEAAGTSMTEFASIVGTTDRTLRKFRQTGKINRGTFSAIAQAMGLTKDDLLNSGK